MPHHIKAARHQGVSWILSTTFRQRLAVVFALSLLPTQVTQAALSLVQIAPMSGPVAVEARKYNAGLRLAIDARNARGGIRGEHVELVTHDDSYDPKTNAALFEKAAKSNALAVLLPIGSPAMSHLLAQKLPASLAMPIIGVIPGAEPFRTPGSPFVFHVRAGDTDQYETMVRHAATIGMQRFAVAYADIPFGRAALSTLSSAIARRHLNLASSEAIPLNALDQFPTIVARLAEVRADVIYLVTPAETAAHFVAEYRRQRVNAMIALPSYGTAETLCAIAGKEAAYGVVIAQVMPNMNNSAIEVARNFQKDFAQFSAAETQPTVMQFEAYLTAQVVFEALDRAGPHVTRQALVNAIEALSSVDIGGFKVHYSHVDHTGSDFVDISIVGKGASSFTESPSPALLSTSL